MGPDQVKFTVHKFAIFSKSNFFQVACDGECTEAKEKIVELSDTDPRLFEAYAHWIYFSEVDMLTVSKTWATDGYKAVMRLWIFADMMMDCKLCNRIIDLIFEKFDPNQETPELAVLRYVWKHTMENSPLRKFCIEASAAAMDGVYLGRNREDFTKDFLADLGMYLIDDTSLFRRVATPSSYYIRDKDFFIQSQYA